MHGGSFVCELLCPNLVCYNDRWIHESSCYTLTESIVLKKGGRGLSGQVETRETETPWYELSSAGIWWRVRQNHPGHSHCHPNMSIAEKLLLFARVTREILWLLLSFEGDWSVFMSRCKQQLCGWSQDVHSLTFESYQRRHQNWKIQRRFSYVQVHSTWRWTWCLPRYFNEHLHPWRICR